MVTSGTATSSAPTVTAGGTEVTVDVTGVANAQRITVTLLSVSDGTNTNDVAVRMGLLTVTRTDRQLSHASDIGQVKAQIRSAGHRVELPSDVNVSGGSINSSDIGLVKANSGSLLPPNPTMRRRTRAGSASSGTKPVRADRSGLTFYRPRDVERSRPACHAAGVHRRVDCCCGCGDDSLFPRSLACL